MSKTTITRDTEKLRKSKWLTLVKTLNRIVNTSTKYLCYGGIPASRCVSYPSWGVACISLADISVTVTETGLAPIWVTLLEGKGPGHTGHTVVTLNILLAPALP